MRRKSKVTLYDYFKLLTKKLKLNIGQIKKTLEGPLQQFPTHKHTQGLFYFNYEKSCSVQAL